MWHLSRGDEVALRGASKGQLLPRDHHHLGAGLVDVGGTHRTRPAAGLDPGGTGGHGGPVGIVGLERWRGERNCQYISTVYLSVCMSEMVSCVYCGVKMSHVETVRWSVETPES